jgi:cytochrome c-type biogenesis protein CcmF
MFQKSIKYDPSRIISHFGFGLLVFFIGINHNYSIEKDFNLRVGEIKNFQNYSINFISLEKEDRKNYTAIVGNFSIFDKKNSLSENLKPEIRIYDNPETLTYEAAIRTKIYSDKYITMSNISRSDFYNIKFQEKPFMIWIWISAVLISVGGVIRIFKREVLT